jgi:hypothetical protein
MKNSILIIIAGSLFIFIIGCGYTVVNKSSTSSEYTNPQQEFNNTLIGLWTKREGGVRQHNGVVDAWILDYYLLLNSNGTYGFSFNGRPHNISGNYHTDSDTLTFVTGRNISKYQFLRDGEILILNFISLEQRNEKSFPVRLEGNWKIKY